VSLPPDVAVRFEGVSKRYRTREVSRAEGARRGWRSVEALRGVDLEVRRGESVALVGRNGAGKTTLLRLVAGVAAPSEGRVLARVPVVGLLGAVAGFHADLSSRENAVLAAAFHGVPRRPARADLGAVLDYAGLAEVADVPAKHLSDGMRLRLALSVALHLPHAVLASDEGLAAADEAFRRRVEGSIRERREAGAAVLLATHDAETVRRLASRAVLLAEGRVEDDGAPDRVLGRYGAGEAPSSPTAPSRSGTHPKRTTAGRRASGLRTRCTLVSEPSGETLRRKGSGRRRG
jgi:ABC-type polysaccharide/polyol phosphate transport system ATPase subunit